MQRNRARASGDIGRYQLNWRARDRNAQARRRLEILQRLEKTNQLKELQKKLERQQQVLEGRVLVDL